MGAAIFVPAFLLLLILGFGAVHGINEVIKFLEKGSLSQRFTKLYERVLGE